MNSTNNSNHPLLGFFFKAHPWHGVPIGEDQPKMVTAYIEIVPQDTIKYELDKHSGLLMVDRPQAFSNICPTLYGFIPQTLCREQVAALEISRTEQSDLVGDDDPLDICILSEKVFPRGDILLQARPIGGLRMIDGGEVDDKLIAVMKADAVFGAWQDISDCPRSLIDRLKHYFLTYKRAPDGGGVPCEITAEYGREEAYQVIAAAHADYLAHYDKVI